MGAFKLLLAVRCSRMKFNDHELSLYAAARIGKSDKEGCLWMREVEGKIRKKQSKLLSMAV